MASARKSTSVTIGIPAYNEEAKIEATINTVLAALKQAGRKDFEILVINDASKDRTREIVEALQRKIKQIRLINNERNMGLGYGFKEIIRQAKCEKICFIPGDDILSKHTIYQYFLNMHRADLIFVFFVNKENRNRIRIFLSHIFNIICTFVFDVHVNYLNGSALYNTAILRSLEIKSDRYFVSAEMNLKFLFKGATFYEVPGYIKPNSVKSNALRISSFFDVVKNFIRIYYEIKFRDKALYNKRPIRVIDDI